jgi:hypothetical protein
MGHNMINKETNAVVFDYRTLRLLMGIIALALPLVVRMISNTALPSVSDYYYTEARDVFVGMVFVVSAFLWAYRGHSLTQNYVSKVASLAAILVALYPTACENCEPSAVSVVHYLAAAILFSILSYFCLGPFRYNTRGQGGKKERRARVYLICGWLMIACMLTAAAAAVEIYVFHGELATDLNVIYWAEAIALGAFGVEWIVS